MIFENEPHMKDWNLSFYLILCFLYLCDVQINVRPLRVHTFTCKSFNMQGFQCAVFNLYVDGASMSEKAVDLCPTKDNSVPWAQIPEWSALLLTSLSTSLSLSSSKGFCCPQGSSVLWLNWSKGFPRIPNLIKWKKDFKQTNQTQCYLGGNIIYNL